MFEIDVSKVQGKFQVSDSAANGMSLFEETRQHDIVSVEPRCDLGSDSEDIVELLPRSTADI